VLAIKQPQIDTLSQSLGKEFQNKALNYIEEFFPTYHQTLDDQTLNNLISHSFKKSQKYGFESKRNAMLFLNLSIMLGADFDTDPQLPWVANTLADEEIENLDEKLDTLHERTLLFLDRIWGEENEFLQQAVNECSLIKFDSLEQKMRSANEEQVLHDLYNIHPEKFQASGLPHMKAMLALGASEAIKYGINNRTGLFIFLTMMLMFGSGFHTDPQYPWAQKALLKKDEAPKAETLYKAGVEYLEQIQANG